MATELKGASQLRYALRNFEPDLAKETQKNMASALKPIVVKARGYIPTDSPLRGWTPRSFSESNFPFFNSSLMRRGISYRTSPTKPNRRGWIYAASIFNKSASGAIYETAGRKNPDGREKAPKGTPRTNKHYSHSNNPRAGALFIAGLERASPMAQGSTKYTREGSGRRGRYMKGRAIFRAWAEDNGKVTTAVTKAIEAAAMEFRARVGKNGK
jgi:hypothetical protein